MHIFDIKTIENFFIKNFGRKNVYLIFFNILETGPKRGDNPKERPETQASLLEARRRLNNVCNDSFQRNYGKIADCLGQIDSFLLKYESAQINERRDSLNVFATSIKIIEKFHSWSVKMLKYEN